MKLMDMEVLQTIDAHLQEITEEHINAAGPRLEPVDKGEKVIGTLECRVARALYLLTRKLKSKAVQMVTDAPFALSDIEAKQMEQDAHKYSAIASEVLDLMWLQTRSDGNSWDGSIGIRTNWQIVAAPDNSPGAVIRKLVRGEE